MILLQESFSNAKIHITAGLKAQRMVGYSWVDMVSTLGYSDSR
jgi:hypothetical protein